MPTLPDAVLLALIVGAFAFCTYTTSRTAPTQVLKGFGSVKEHLKEQAQRVATCEEEMLALRGSWRVQTQEIEAYLESIDSRARRVSATESNARRKKPNDADQPVALDTEGMLIQARRSAGL